MPLAVQALQAFGDGAGADRVRQRKEVDDVAGVFHAAGGVQARRQPKSHVPGADLFARQAGKLNQGGQARLRGLLQGRESEPGDDAVFTQKGHNVGNGPDGDDFEERLEQFWRHPVCQKRLRQLECHAHARQRLFGVIAIRPPRVQDGAGGGQVAVGQVVVGHDAVHAQVARALQHGVLANAGVHADHQAEAPGRRLLNHRHAHAVTIGQAVGNVSFDFRPQHAQGGEQHHHGHGAIHVVVAVDQDFLALFDGPAQARHRLAHPRHPFRRVKLIETGTKKRLRGGGVGHPSLHQQARDQRGDVKFAGQGPGGCFVNR